MAKRAPVAPRVGSSEERPVPFDPPGNAPNSTVDRALRVLEAFLADEDTLGVLDLSRHLGLDKSVIHRILSTLVARRFLEQDPVTRRYRVGLRIWELGQHYLAGQLLTDVAEKELSRMIAGHSYATGYLAKLDGGDVVVVSTIRGPGPINLYMDPGSRLAAELTTTGRTLLAYLPPAKAAQIIARRRVAGNGRREVPSATDLEDELAAIRRRGYGENIGGYAAGVNTAAVALCDSDGTPVLALSVDFLSMPETEGLSAVIPIELQECIGRIEHILQTAAGEVADT